MYFDLIKAFHLIAIISWMVGLLYLPRIYVYHNDCKLNSDTEKTFLVMEYKLQKFIMYPAFIVTYILGFIMLYFNSYLLLEVYFLIKIISVLLMAVFHFYLTSLYKDFKKGYRLRKTRFYRQINEIPTILMIIIILLVVLKPDF